MKKKYVLSTLLLSVTTSFGLLSFTACNTTDNPRNENTNPPTFQEEPDTQRNIDLPQDTGKGNNDTQDFDGTKIKRGTLIDDTDSPKNNLSK